MLQSEWSPRLMVMSSWREQAGGWSLVSLMSGRGVQLQAMTMSGARSLSILGSVVATMSVLPAARAARCVVHATAAAVARSRAWRYSSIRMTGAGVRRARAILYRASWPHESSAGIRHHENGSDRPTAVKRRVASWGSWEMVSIRGSSAGWTALASQISARIRDRRISSVLLFPEPLGPVIRTIEPCGISSWFGIDVTGMIRVLSCPSPKQFSNFKVLGFIRGSRSGGTAG